MADIRKVGNIPDEAEILDEQMEGLMIKPVTKAAADISEYLKGLTSINAIIGKKAALQLDPNPKLTPDEKTRITTELDKALKEMLDQERKKQPLIKSHRCTHYSIKMVQSFLGKGSEALELRVALKEKMEQLLKANMLTCRKMTCRLSLSLIMTMLKKSQFKWHRMQTLPEILLISETSLSEIH